MKILLAVAVILSTLTAQNGMYILEEDSDVTSVMIHGNGEKCMISLTSIGDIEESSCRILTNSKNVQIFCTRRKKICKTHREIYNFMQNSTNSQNYYSSPKAEVSSYQRCLDNSSSTYEMRVCNGNELDYQDGLLNRYYKQAMRRLSKNEKRKLRNAQRAWIKYRDAKCESEGKSMRGGTGEFLLIGGCLVETTTQRAKELRAM
jgi:uncharacterized protein YecT (DUF1311 family)